MSEQWPLRKLSEVIEIQNGFAFSSREYTEEGHFLIRIGNVQDGELNLNKPKYVSLDSKSSKFELSEGDLLTSLTGNIGRVACVEKSHLPAALNQRVARMKVSDSSLINSDFLYYFLRSDGFRNTLTASGHGTAQKNVSTKAIGEIEIPLPPLNEQHRIVMILDVAFEKLAEKSQQIHSRLNGAEDLFGSYLSDLFSKKHQGWEETKVGEVVTLQGGSQPPKAVFSAEYLEGYIRLIQIRDYKSDKHIVYIPKEKARRFCTKEDIMIGRYGPPLFQILRGIEGAYNVALMKAIPDEQYLTKDFLYYFLQNRDLLRYIERSSSRTAGQTGFKKETLESYTITYPKSKEQQLQLVEKLDTLKEKITNIIVNYEREIHMVEELKQSILQEAFAGKLTGGITA